MIRSAMVSSKVEADLLILMTDIDGLYTKNQRRQRMQEIPVVKEITPEIESYAEKPVTKAPAG